MTLCLDDTSPASVSSVQRHAVRRTFSHEQNAALKLGIYAEVLRPGTVWLGDELRFA